MKVNMIVAADINLGIGLNNRLPWKFSKDMKYFKEKTIGNNAIIMGRNTFESIKHVLPNRKNYILSKTPHLNVLGAIIIHNPQDIFKLVQYDEIWIIGGDSIYKHFLLEHPKEINEIYITRINKKYKCDTFFPKIPAFFNKINSITTSDIDKNNNEKITISFETYKS